LNEAREDGVAMTWTICRSFELCSRLKTALAPHHSIVYRPGAMPGCCPTNSIRALKANVNILPKVEKYVQIFHCHTTTTNV